MSASPVVADDFVLPNPSASACERFQQLLSISEKLYAFFGYAFDGSGNLQSDFWIPFAAKIMPPGTLMLHRTSAGTLADAKLEVDALWGGDSSNPFWRICNGLNGTPDLRAKFLVGAYDVSDGSAELAADVSIKPPGSSGGVENVALTVDQLPELQFDLPQGYELDGSGGTPKLIVDADAGTNTSILKTNTLGGGDAHTNLPPYYAIVPIVRTSRVS